MYSKIQALTYYLPNNELTNQDLEKRFDRWDASKIETKVGIRKRHIASHNETALDLGFKAAEKLFINEKKDEIDFLIFCTQAPDYFLPSGSCILQDKLELRKNIGAFDINLGCSGFVYGLSIADSFIKSGLATNVLLITADTYSKFINPKDISNLTIFGDAGAATIISRSEEEKIYSFKLGTDGTGYDKLIVASGGCRKTNVELQEKDKFLYMDGPEIFNFTLEVVPKLVIDTLNKSNTSFEDIDLFIFHQANKYMLEFLRKKIRIPKEKFYIEMLDTGNTASSTLPIALHQCLEKGIANKGDKIMLAGFGVGLSWAGTIVEL